MASPPEPSAVTTALETPGIKPKHYRWNSAGGLIHGIFFQLSEAFSNISTVLRAFIATLTGSAIVIGLIVLAQEVGHVVPQMITA